MPRGVLHVVRINRLMQLELFSAVFVATRIILRDSPLPILRLASRIEVDRFIEIRQRLRDPPGSKHGCATDLINRRGFRIQLQKGVSPQRPYQIDEDLPESVREQNTPSDLLGRRLSLASPRPMRPGIFHFDEPPALV